MKSVFLNEFGRLRSGWRFTIFLFFFLLITTILGAGLFTIFQSLSLEIDKQNFLFLTIGNLMSFVAAVIIGWLCGKFLEGLPFRALGLSFTDRWLRHLMFGLAFGALAILLASAIAVVFGGIRFQLNQIAGSYAIGSTLGASLLIFIIGAASEEAIFRGYILQTFTRAHLGWYAVALTSVFFAAAHLGNPNANWISTLNTAIAGILFGVSYLKTRTLWFPFGLHLTWNWVQGAFLGIPVSGLEELTPAPLLQRIDYGPVWLTGGDYGIEGGITGTLALVAIVFFIWYAPFLKPTEEMLALTDNENPVSS